MVTAECVGTEAAACNGLAAGGAGETVMGEGLGMVTVACMGRGAAQARKRTAPRREQIQWLRGSSVSVGGGTFNTVV